MSFISIFLDCRLSKKKENLFYRWSLEVSDEVTRIERKKIKVQSSSDSSALILI